MVLLILAGAAVGSWRLGFFRSDVDRGLEQLNLTYKDRRPTEARISGFDYAPFPDTTRGKTEQSGEAQISRYRADTFFRRAASGNRSAEGLQGEGKLYLSDNEFEKAEASFQRAAKLDPENPRLQNDWGASLFEMSKNADEGARRLELLDQSLAHFDKALTLAPGMPEVLFNRSLCLQFLPAALQAMKSWNEFLAVDDRSGWSEEARKNLQNIEATLSREKNADELEADFLDASARQDKAEAAGLIGRNRELIREKYLPQRLAMSFVNADKEKRERYLQALKFAGELEFSQTGDPFARDLAGFYERLSSPEKREILKKAHEAVRSGYKACLENRFGDAMVLFETAQKSFAETGDIWEAKLAEYFTSYCLINSKSVEKGVIALQQIADFAEEKQYKWLSATALYWLAGGLLRQQESTESRRIYEKALVLAREIDDPYSLQRNLLALADYNYVVGQHRKALGYLNDVLKVSNASETSLRQKQRNYTSALPILVAAGFESATKPVSIEAVHLADNLDNSIFKVLARSNAGFACVQAGDMPGAKRWLEEAEKAAGEIPDENSRKDMQAYTLLRKAYYERKNGDSQRSADDYSRSAELFRSLERPFTAYAAMKGKVMAYTDLGNEVELEAEIPKVIKFAEDYRGKILAEQERSSFFDTEDSIYEMAVNHAIRIQDAERAYNYAEGGSSRALLDWLQKGAKIIAPQDQMPIELDQGAVPLNLSQITARMPDNAQIVQYAVLEDRLVIWVISKTKFVMVPVTIDSKELRRKVEGFVESIKNTKLSDGVNEDETAKELYELLIGPVKEHLDPTKQVCLIPSKFLLYLPFAALISPGGDRLLNEFILSYSPSASVFIECTENAGRKSAAESETILSIGNPAFDPEQFEEFSDLPDADEEAVFISGLYDRSLTFIGEKAEKQRIMASIKDAAVLHFAGHYVVVQDAPMTSFLLLARNQSDRKGSMLSNMELGAQKLPKAKLIVLSACATGIETFMNGEGLIGLSRTFLAAGAPVVVASQWSVESKATAALMKRFHFFRRKAGMTTSAALQKAQLEMAQEPNGKYADPYYWAAFGVLGGYSNY